MNHIPSKILALFAFAAVTGGASAATVLTSTTAPTVDGLDEANLVTGTGRLKWFDDVEHDAGQTFTPASHWRQVKRNPLKFSRLGQKNYEKALT
jgi:hypothetical protein